LSSPCREFNRLYGFFLKYSDRIKRAVSCTEFNTRAHQELEHFGDFYSN
jgi:hypothetical protein